MKYLESFLLFIVLLLFTTIISCTPKTEVIVDSISIQDEIFLTTFDSIEIFQLGLTVKISSLDFKNSQKYTVTISSPDSLYTWTDTLNVITEDRVPTIIFPHLLIPASQQFPPGTYNVEILQEDASFMTSSFTYTRVFDRDRISSIDFEHKLEDGENLFNFQARKNISYKIEFYDKEDTLLLTKNSSDGIVRDVKFTDEFISELDKVIVIAISNGIHEIYRIIL